MGNQNNLKICACGSAHVSPLRSSANKVQLTLLRLGNLVLDFFFQLLNTSEEHSFYIITLERLQNTRPTKSLTKKILPQSHKTSCSIMQNM